MSKYIPKVGEEFQFSGESSSWSRNKKAVFVTPLEVVWLGDDGLTQFAIIGRSKFRPIPTKADVEREQLEALLADYVSAEISSTVYVIQKAGFTIPKKVKRINIWEEVESEAENLKESEVENIVYRICELLGDLVESDV